MRILLVEDEIEMAAALRGALALQGGVGLVGERDGVSQGFRVRAGAGQNTRGDKGDAASGGGQSRPSALRHAIPQMT